MRTPRKTTENEILHDVKLVARVLREFLHNGESVELEGLGVFVPEADATTHFVANMAPRIFIGYAMEDFPAANRLYSDLLAAGMSPWLDRRKLLPGQAWSRCIERAIESSDFFIACFSTISAAKRGYFPYEIRYALRSAERMPLDDLFVIPLRLDDCRVPRVISAHTQCLDMFPDWQAGLAQLISSVREEMSVRRSRQAA